jgi:membrane fusion protein, peptide pheromone/bacteriocin exporter
MKESEVIWNVNPESTVEFQIHNNSVKTQILYLIVLIFIIIVSACLPFIKIDISIQANGIIRPLAEKSEIKIIPTESVTKINVKEGQFIQQGDTLVTLCFDKVNSKLQFTKGELYKVESYIDDLKYLISNIKEFNSTDVLSNLYKQQSISYLQRLQEIGSRISIAVKELERNQKLFDNSFISSKELENINFTFNNLIAERELMTSTQLIQWKTDLMKFQTTQESYISELYQLNKEKDTYIIKSPVTGTIEEFQGIYNGSILHSGQTIAIISPSSEIIAEIYVSSKDIGYINKETLVRIQIDAFNYNEWGMIPGIITDISDDFVLVNNTPFFKVKCRLEKNYLQLKSGFKGCLKKGMTLHAKFLITKRSLIQLIYQKSDDWINPSREL